MKKIFLSSITFFFISCFAYSQKSLSDYAFVLVPTQFEYQSSRDQFQINSLIRHLLNTSGFNAIYEEELKGLEPCDGLLLDLIEERSLLRSKIEVVLKDCTGRELYRSPQTTSKEKDRKLVYHEAIRKAFVSIQALSVQQKNLEAYRNAAKTDVVQDVKANEIVVKEEKVSKATKQSTKPETYTTYQFEGKEYLLEKTDGVYILFLHNLSDKNVEKLGQLKKTLREGIYLYESHGESNLANFDSANNLIIDGKDASGNPVQMKFLLKKED